MKIGIDLHGVITKSPEYFKDIMLKLKARKAVIYIVSGPPEVEVEEELKKYKIYRGTHFDQIVSIVDYLKQKGAHMWQDNKDRWWTDEETWWSSKANICKDNGIDMMIDDKEEYKKYFTAATKFILY